MGALFGTQANNLRACSYYQVSASTIKRRLSEVQQVWEQPLLEQAGFVHIDATYWGRGAGILLAIDHHTARPLYLEFIRNECAQDYRRALESISRRGYIIRGVVVDGTRTLFSLFAEYPCADVPVSYAADYFSTT